MDSFIVPRERLLHYLCNKPKLLTGDRIYLELIQHPDQLIHCSQLRYGFCERKPGTREFESQTSDDQMEKQAWINVVIGNWEVPIEITDKSTLLDCRHRLMQLHDEAQTLKEWNDFGRLQDIRDEINFILRFIKECTTNSGKIKKTKDKQEDDYRAVLKSIKRANAHIARDEPDLLPFIKAHIKIGLYCVWRDDV